MSRREMKRCEENDPSLARAIGHNTKWFRPLLRTWGNGWKRRITDKLDRVIDHSKDAIRKLNDQFVSPSGDHNADENKKS